VFLRGVQIEVSGESEGMGYRHCRSCRWWSAAPVNAFTLWKPGAVRITEGPEYVGMFQKPPASQRQYCQRCGGHLMTNHPLLRLERPGDSELGRYGSLADILTSPRHVRFTLYNGR